MPDIWAWLGREAHIEKGWIPWAQGYQESRGDEAYRMRQVIYDVVYDLLSTGVVQKGGGYFTLEDSFRMAEAIAPGLSFKLSDDSNR